MNRNIPLLSIAVAAAFVGVNANATAVLVNNPAEIGPGNTFYSPAFPFDGAYDFDNTLTGNAALKSPIATTTPFSDTFTVTTSAPFSNISVSLSDFSASHGTYLNPTLTLTGGSLVNAPLALSGLTTYLVTAGTYTLTFSGSLVSDNTSPAGSSGAFSGVLYTAAVPEASAWAMMILGLGMVGFAARRRSQSTTVSYAF